MAETVSQALATLCLRHRKAVLASVAVVTTLAAGALPGARFDNALELWFLDDDPALAAHRNLLDTFGTDELIVIGLEAADVFDGENLRRIDRITRAAARAPHVEAVSSLTNVEAIRSDRDALDVGPLIEMPWTDADLPAIRELALTSRLYVNSLVSDAGDFTNIVVRIAHRSDDLGYKLETVGALREILAAEGDDARLYLSGAAVLDAAMFEHSIRDSRTMAAATSVLLAAVLALLLRSTVGVVVPLATVILATVWALGGMAVAGVRMSFLTTMLPPLLLAVGVAGSMHVLVEYRSRYSTDSEKLQVLREVFSDLTPPLLLTSATTSLGLLSLAVSRVDGIREFALFAALGVQAAFLLSVTFVPVVLSYAPAPRPLPQGRAAGADAWSSALRAVHRFSHARGSIIGAAFVAVALVGLAGAAQIRSEAVFLEMLPDGDRVKNDTRRIENALAGTLTIDVVIDSGEAEGVKDPVLLARMRELQRFMEEQPIVSSSVSVADHFVDLRQALFRGDPRERRLPGSREEAAQYLLLYEMDAPDGEINDYVTFDYRRARVSGRVDIESSNALTALAAKLEAYAREHFGAPFTATVAGVSVLYASMERHIRSSLIRGFGIAFIAIFAVMCLLTRSVALGAIAMLPNLAPILVCLGLMGYAGIQLDSMTAMVASIVIGLAVDDSIHLITRIRRHLGDGDSMDRALEKATVGVGRPLTYTTLALVAGFGVMSFAHFVGIAHFGALCAATIFVALAADLLLLPVVLRWHDARRRSVAAASMPRLELPVHARQQAAPERST